MKNKKNIQILSVLNTVSVRVFNAETLEEAQGFMTECLITSEIDENDKQMMLTTLKTKTTLKTFHAYFTNCILKYEGLGVIK